jgi:putative phosphoesterase
MKLLIISDIHGNWAALQAVLRAESNADKIIGLGDLVGYGPEPVACVNWALQQQSRSIFVQGNHDWGVAWKEDPRSSLPYRHLAAVTQAFCLEVLSPEMLDFLRELNPVLTFRLAGQRFFACHATPGEPLFRYLHMSGGELLPEVEIAGSPDFLLLGHTHFPFVKSIAGTTVVNPGSVGQPKDGHSSASYAVWNDGQVQLRRAAYPIEDTVGAYAQSLLASSEVERLVAVLRTGGRLPLFLIRMEPEQAHENLLSYKIRGLAFGAWRKQTLLAFGYPSIFSGRRELARSN